VLDVYKVIIASALSCFATEIWGKEGKEGKERWGGGLSFHFSPILRFATIIWPNFTGGRGRGRRRGEEGGDLNQRRTDTGSTTRLCGSLQGTRGKRNEGEKKKRESEFLR